jgi:general secretion pathway protein C
MDATKIAGIWKGRSPEHWLRMANRFAPAAVTAVLVLVIAHQLAELTWIAVPSSTYDRPPPVVAPPRQAGGARAGGADLSAIADAHLFGVAAEQARVPQQTVVDAPETTLSVTLTGLVADDDPAGGQAIISSGRDREKNYGVGQSIEGGGGATVHAVYGDRVILNRNGRLETLRLPKELSTSARAAPVPVAPPPVPSDSSLREVISDNATKFTDIVRIAPQMEGGQMVGFRLNPGRDRETFEALGLKPGDVVTDINGTLLDDPTRGLQVFQSLGEATQATVTIVRDGAPTVLVIDTSQLASLGENRQ